MVGIAPCHVNVCKRSHWNMADWIVSIILLYALSQSHSKKIPNVNMASPYTLFGDWCRWKSKYWQRSCDWQKCSQQDHILPVTAISIGVILRTPVDICVMIKGKERPSSMPLIEGWIKTDIILFSTWTAFYKISFCQEKMLGISSYILRIFYQVCDITHMHEIQHPSTLPVTLQGSTLILVWLSTTNHKSFLWVKFTFICPVDEWQIMVRNGQIPAQNQDILSQVHQLPAIITWES